MRRRKDHGRSRLLLLPALVALIALALTGGAAAHGDDEPLDQHEVLIEIVVEDRFQVDELNDAGVDLAEYLRENDDGTITLNAYLTPGEIDELEAQGYVFGEVVEDYQNWLDRMVEREAAMAAEQAALDFAEGEGVASHPDEGADVGLFTVSLMAAPEIQPERPVHISRADYFTNYAGRFISIEARRAGTSTGSSPTLAASWRTEEGSYGSATSMSIFNDASQYMYHRTLIRVGAAGSSTPVPAYVRVATSTGAVAEEPVRVWPGNTLPPLPETYLQGFFNSYMDPSQVTERFESLAAEFPNIAELIELPNKSHGLGWPTAIMAGTTTSATPNIGSAPSGTPGASGAVVLYSKAPSPEGERTRAQFRNPGAPDSPLTVTVNAGNPLGGSDIIVDLGTSSTGALNSTAAQVAAAINANADAAELVNATTYPTSQAGAGITQARNLVALSDFMNPPAHFRMGQFTSKMLRISTRPAAGQPDERGERVGIYLYCQQHAREWVTPITCVETAERLLRNYGTHAETTEFVDNLDIFIFPSVNPDGSHLSMMNLQGGSGGVASKRTNMANTCSPTSSTYAPTSGNVLSQRGVDLNRNNFWGNGSQGYAGSSTSCNGETNRGPFPHSEPENQNEIWVANTFTNIKFANNIHTYGGYFMWAPGAYRSAGRVTLPAPNIGEEGYFFQAADTVLERIRQYRGTVVLPQRTGPIADVLYSAGGNSADQQWYENGIIAYSFEAGSDRFSSTTTGTSQSAVGFQPNFANEGRHEAMEFANGNYGLFEAALAYARDTEAPEVDMTGARASQTPVETTFKWVNEPSKIYYTFDGSQPTTDSPLWQAERPRQPGQRFLITETTTVRWLAVDMKGNESTGSTRFSIDTTPPTIDFVTPVDEGQYLLDSEHEVEFSCDDDDAGIVRCEGTQDNGDLLDTSSIGYKTFTVEAEDAAGNTTTTSVTYNVHWPFDGPGPPFGVRNEVQAGSAYPVRFSLGGDRGLDVFAEGYPKSKVCGADDSTLESTQQAEAFTFADGEYKYVWKTRPQWKGQCRELVLRFVDNTEQRATFELKN
ncbi:MAG TPA: M14 family zinc carboxypeptidase [Actinomycetota bacterium]|nr:M14 family zinc carboxypeptidase [Actinomycetota bacterium]